MFYLTTHSTHFIYGYMASNIWLRTILIVRKETCCHNIGHSFRITARVLLYAPSHRQDSTYHGLCYTSRGALAGTRNRSIGRPPHEGSIRRPITPRANALTTELRPAPRPREVKCVVAAHLTDEAQLVVSALVTPRVITTRGAHLRGARRSSWCDGSSDRSFTVEPLSYFSFQPVFHDCCMCYPVWRQRVSSLSLSEWSFTICLTPYNRK